MFGVGVVNREVSEGTVPAFPEARLRCLRDGIKPNTLRENSLWYGGYQ